MYSLHALQEQTGPSGANYKQKTQGMVCDELKIVDNMKAYVTETVSAAKAYYASVGEL